ncbi:MAG: hypothetical protein LBP67_05080 [Bacteroidales bacterium]|jgi:hypothetical protein|nr:hypothetical protein [Bacteroidales bacterium]
MNSKLTQREKKRKYDRYRPYYVTVPNQKNFTKNNCNLCPQKNNCGALKTLRESKSGYRINTTELAQIGATSEGLNVVCQLKAYINASEHIHQAIEQASGIPRDKYLSKTQRMESVYCRMIFVSLLPRVSSYFLSLLINRTRSNILVMQKKYDDEVKYNRKFRELVKKVNEILKTKTDEEIKELDKVKE